VADVEVDGDIARRGRNGEGRAEQPLEAGVRRAVVGVLVEGAVRSAAEGGREAGAGRPGHNVRAAAVRGHPAGGESPRSDRVEVLGEEGGGHWGSGEQGVEERGRAVL